jgi:4'-phosphopantetheinyl transferase
MDALYADPVAGGPLDRAVQVWTALCDRLGDPACAARWAAVLSDEELQRHRRFMFERDRHSFLAAHAATRLGLSRYADVEPRSWRFTPGPYGRPELVPPPGAPPLHFNLSHTDGMGICAVALGREVGADVERVDSRTPSREVAERFFAPPEHRTLTSLEGDAFRQRFFRYWTLKEAYIKARGMGLHLPLDQFWFDLDGPEIRIHFEPGIQDDPARWQFGTFQVGPSHRVSVALERRPGEPPLEIQILPLP